MTGPDMEAVLADFRRTTEVSLARIEGQLALLLQRQDQQDRRADAQDARLTKHDDRLDGIERNQVTREDLEKRSARILGWIGLIVAVVSIVAAATTSTLIAVIK